MPAKRSKRTKQNGHRPIHQRIRRWARKHTTLLGLTASLPVIVGLIIFFADPFSTPTATEADGSTVETGVIETENAAPRARRPAPNFVLADYEGNAVRLSDFRGKTVMLNFWATWCTTCEQEMPDMQRLAQDRQDDVVVLAVNQAESRGRAQAWSDSRDLGEILFVLDEAEDVTRAYKLPSGLPHSFFIDEHGMVQYVHHGGLRYDEMQQRVNDTIAAARAAADSGS